MSALSGRENEYLARCVKWNWHDDATIDVCDAGGQVAAHLNEWQTLVFHHADGSTSTQDILVFLAERYGNQVPQNYERDILSSAEDLVFGLKAVELWQRKDNLADEFDLPMKEQGGAHSAT